MNKHMNKLNTHFDPVNFINKSRGQFLWADRHHLQQTVHNWDSCWEIVYEFPQLPWKTYRQYVYNFTEFTEHF